MAEAKQRRSWITSCRTGTQLDYQLQNKDAAEHRDCQITTCFLIHSCVKRETRAGLPAVSMQGYHNI
eukprot:586785-Karenia_brevis.AAC.1